MTIDNLKHHCSFCPIRFAKSSKLEQHLLDVHGAYWGLSPGNPGGPVAALVSRAVTRANRAFDGIQAPASVPCAVCPRGATFRNPRDLAHHILSKHPDNTPSPDDISKVSNMKRKSSAATAAATTNSTSKKVKKVSKSEIEPAIPVEPKPSAAKPPLSPKGGSREGSPKLVTAPNKRSGSTKDTIPKKTERISVGLDFSSVVGFTPNARKSYYRVVKR